MVYNPAMLATERRNQEGCKFVTRSKYTGRTFSKIKRKRGMKKKERMDSGNDEQKL